MITKRSMPGTTIWNLSANNGESLMTSLSFGCDRKTYLHIYMCVCVCVCMW